MPRPSRCGLRSGPDAMKAARASVAPADEGSAASASAPEPVRDGAPADEGSGHPPPQPKVRAMKVQKRARNEENDDETSREPLQKKAEKRRACATSSRKDTAAASSESDAQAALISYQSVLAKTLSQNVALLQQEKREKLRRDSRRLGRCRRGLLGSASERDAAVQWEGGEEFEGIAKLRDRISEQRQQLQQLRDEIRRPRSKAKDAGPPTAQELEQQEEDIWEQKQLIESKNAAIQKAEAELKDRENKLAVDRNDHVRRLREADTEDCAELSGKTLRHRFHLLRCLARERRCEVYEAHDLHNLQACVVRVHKIDPNLPEREREERVLQVKAECDGIMKLKHFALAALLEHFHLEGGSTYVTVWEFCEGDTLQAYLQRNGSLQEREAKGIYLQLLSMAKFAENRGLNLSYKDIQPQSLVFRLGEVKVPIFGLEKLRSTGRTPSALLRNSSVDSIPCGDTPEMEDNILGTGARHTVLWNLGAVLHEMLFGKKPGSRALDSPPLDTCQVILPDQPRISAEAREHLMRVLSEGTHTPTVQDVFGDLFSNPKRKG